MEKRNKKVRNNGIFYVVISLIAVLGLAGFVRADISLKELIANKVATILGEKISTELGLIVPEEVNLGAMPGPDVYQEMFFHEQVLSDFAVSQPIAVPATTTKNVIANGRDLTAVVAKYTNTTGKTIVCEGVRLPIITSSDTWTFSYGVGTTTLIADSPSWTNTTTATLIASTTATAANDVTADRFAYFTSEGQPGTYFTASDKGSSTAFVLENGVSIVAYIHTIDATSSDSFEKKDGHKLTGSLQANCHYIDY